MRKILAPLQCLQSLKISAEFPLEEEIQYAYWEKQTHMVGCFVLFSGL